jgi:ketosteroid isomerase-like protein
VTIATKDPRIAAALAAVNQLDRAVIDDDHGAFAALMADDLAVNNPQNTLSLHGATAQLNARGLISYAKYDRIIEYAGLRGDMVLLMGEELCVPKPPHPLAGQSVRRRFTDFWKKENGRWLLTARQATIVPPAR